MVGSHNSAVGVSTNWGITWTTNYFPDSASFYCSAIAASSDASKLIAARLNINGGTGSIYTSTNSGTTWLSNNVAISKWFSVASSADGTTLTAVVFGGRIYGSTNSGANWNQMSSSIQNWQTVASSADGNKLEAGISFGSIWTSQTTPAPTLNLTPTNGLQLSWLIPSTNFVLQQNSDLTVTSWSDVTNVPVLNLTTLQNQVTLPRPAGNSFFRLKTP